MKRNTSKPTRDELHLDASAAPDGRGFARGADVVLAALTLAAGLIAAVLGVGGAPGSSTLTDEARAPTALPPLTWARVLDGSFTGTFEAHLADHFPLRGELLGLDAAMRRARGLRPSEEDVVVYRVSPEAIELGAEPELHAPDEATDEPDVLVAGEASDAAPEAERARAPASTQEDHRARESTRVLGRILIRDGRAMQSFGGGPAGAPAYARMLNAIHAAVGGRATIYSVIVPTAQEFYLPEGSRTWVRDEHPNILATYARLAPGIRTVDVYPELAAHTEEDVYFRTDHHWTGLGAYYGYRAFCRAADIEPVPLDRMERRVVARRWHGSLFRLTRDPDLRADQVEIQVPPAEVEVRIPSPRHGPDRVVPLFHDGSTGYDVFLGGDHPIMRAQTSTRNGRRAILVKNSYGNAFAVYLVSHYEELVFVDYRSFSGRLLELLEESDKPTDLIFMNGTLTANSRAHTALLRRLLDSRG